MIPISLSIEGLYSYKDKQTIDFTPLTQAGIFGIFGKTGSGKSSVLEAISYALYGETERMNNRESRSYNMMNLQSDSLHIDFVCTSELDSHTYRCIVTGKRNKKDFNKVPSLERSCYKKEGTDWKPIAEKQAGKIITGLSYEHFKRTMIIPQGHFMEFLELSPTDRTKMMKDIFHLHNYDLYDATKTIRNKTLEELTLHKGNLQQIGELSPEELDVLRTQLTEIEKEREKTQKKREVLAKEVDALSRVADDYVDLEKNKQQLQELETQKEIFLQKEKQIQHIQYVTTHFTPLLLAETPKRTEKKQLTEKIRNISEVLAKNEETFSSVQKKFTALQTEFEEIPHKTAEIESIKHLIISKKLAEERDILTARIHKGTVYIREQEKEISALRSDISSSEKRSEEKRETQGDITVLSEKKTELDHYKLCLTQIEQARKERVAIEETRKDISQKIIATFALLGISSDSVSFDFATYSEQKKKALLDEKQEETQAIHKIHIKEEIAFLHTHLEEGKPCPVCGSTSHPDASTKQITETDSSHHEKRIKEIDAQLSDIEKQTQKLTQLLYELEQEGKKDKVISEKMHKLTIERNLCEPDEKPEIIEAQFKQYGTIQKEIEVIEKDIKTKRLTLENKEKEYTKNKVTIDDFAKKESNLQTEISVHINQCSKECIETYSDYSKEKLENRVHTRTEEIETCKTQFSKTSQHKEDLQTKIKEQQANLKLLEEQKTAIELELDKLEKQIAENLIKSPFSSLEEIHEINKNAATLIDITKELENYRYTVTTTKNRISELQKKLEHVSFSETVFEEKKKLFADIDKSYISLTEKHIQLKQEVKQYEENISKQKHLISKIETISHRLDNIQTCLNLFKSNGFVNFISTKYLHMLCDIANKQFSILTRHALQLEIEEDNSFIVRDFLNNGKIRHIKTLSGGQAFQAALSLALALAEIIHIESPVASNFFFIDEGFGSQDKESLQIVFETLQSLQKNGKTVGMISHVEELKEFIPAYISVHNHEHGSKVQTL
ncbi:MAG: AAA family ATPase [Bacteroidales bacterium]|jgi:exonuclease SbcC|nr:AAA family ATPase [Bacteroidales bacterium]